MKELFHHLFFMVFMWAVIIFWFIIAWDTHNIVINVLAIISLVAILYATHKEKKWLEQKKKDNDETE